MIKKAVVKKVTARHKKKTQTRNPVKTNPKTSKHKTKPCKKSINTDCQNTDSEEVISQKKEERWNFSRISEKALNSYPTPCDSAEKNQYFSYP
jgi:hypothetical protein